MSHSTTFSICCSGASQMLEMDDEVSDSAIIASAPIKHNAFSVFWTPDTENPYVMEIGQPNNAPMQATALSGRPKVLLG